MTDYWYENRQKLLPETVVELEDNTMAKLDRRVPGDGTKWYCATEFNGHWSYDDYTIEPGEIKRVIK